MRLVDTNDVTWGIQRCRLGYAGIRYQAGYLCRGSVVDRRMWIYPFPLVRRPGVGAGALTIFRPNRAACLRASLHSLSMLPWYSLRRFSRLRRTSSTIGSVRSFFFMAFTLYVSISSLGVHITGVENPRERLIFSMGRTRKALAMW